MAKRPQLGTYAQPVSNFVQPIAAEKTVTPLDEQAIRETYAFANAFADLSESMVKVASTIKTEQNQEEFNAGQEMVNTSRKTYADLVRSGQIKPSENPWLAVGAQEASGVIEASKARAEFERKYQQDVTNNPELLKDHEYFDALAASFAQTKGAEFGTAQYLSRSFYKEFNPFLLSASAKHSEAVGKYRQAKIIDSLKLKVDEVISAVGKSRSFGRRPDGSYKDVGYYGTLFGLDGSGITEMSIGVEIEGREMDIPMLVPGLSLEAREAIVFGDPDKTANELLNSIPAKDRALIFSHAEERVKQGKSPFFSTMDDQQIPNLQVYLDEMGKNMGMPRVANIAVASHLIELMKGSGMTYEAEEILNGLQAGTGPLAETEDVRSMLVDARADISKNRFEIRKSQQTAVIETFIKTQFDEVYNTVATRGEDAVMGPDFESFRTLMKGMDTLGVEEENKLLNQYVESWNKARKEGASFIDAASMNTLSRRFSEGLARDPNPVKDFAALRQNFNAELVRLNIPLDSEKGRAVVRKMMAKVDAAVQGMVPTFIAEVNKELAEAARNRGERNAPTITSLYPEANDSDEVAAVKAKFRGEYNLNRINAGIHFDSPELLADYRRVALNAITYDVERGVDARLADLIYAYNYSTGGQFPTETLLGSGPGKQRMETFLQSVRGKMLGGMPIGEAVRDSAQAASLNLPSLALTDIASNGTQAEELRIAMTEAREEWLENQSALGSFFENFDLFGWTVPELNPDSEGVLHSYYAEAYMTALNDTKDHSRAIEIANDSLNDLTFYNGGVLPQKDLKKYNVDTFYMAEFIAMEANGVDATMVIVGRDQRGEPVFALRTPQGNSINQKYYTLSGITKPEIRGEIIIRMNERRKRTQQREVEEAKARERSGLPRMKL